ncbi:MAG TPA: hypothetical protein VN436_10525, partial [Holophaga sp.]|nr:hypothetical protein [Holophaga sp.]
ALLFVIVSLTGIFMHAPGAHALHEVSGYLFILAGLGHLWINRKPFLDQLRRPAAWITLGVGAVACVALLLAGPHDQRRGAGGPPPSQGEPQ